MLAAPLLAVALAVLYWFGRNDVRAFARFKTFEDSARRQRTLLRWAAQAFAGFLLVPLTGLALLGRLDALFALPGEFASLAIDMPRLPSLRPGFVGVLLAAVVAGGAIGGVLAGLRRRRGGPARVPGPDISAMLPRNRAETLRIALLASNAALSEEIFFRLYLPLLMTLLGLDARAAFGVAAVLFGLMHRYQGWIGVVLTLVLGVGFTMLYWAGGGLAYPILAHLLINLNGLLLRPLVTRLVAPRGD